MTAKEVRYLILEAVWAAMSDGKMPGLVLVEPEVYPDEAKLIAKTQSGEFFEVSVQKRGS